MILMYTSSKDKKLNNKEGDRLIDKYWTN